VIDWATVYPALRTWFLAGTGLSHCIVENQPAPYATNAYGVLEVVSVRQAGDDEVGTRLVSGDYRPVIRGQREFSLKVEVWSVSQADGAYSVKHLERLRILALLPRLKAPLAAVEVALATFGESAMTDVEVDDHWWSVWTATLTFHAAFETVLTDNPADEVGVIETVNGTYQVPTDHAAKPVQLP